MLAESRFEAEQRLGARGSFARGGRAAGPGTRSVPALPAGAQDTARLRVGLATSVLARAAAHGLWHGHRGPRPRARPPQAAPRRRAVPTDGPASRCAGLELADPEKLRGPAAAWGSRRPTPRFALQMRRGRCTPGRPGLPSSAPFVHTVSGKSPVSGGRGPVAPEGNVHISQEGFIKWKPQKSEYALGALADVRHCR